MLYNNLLYFLVVIFVFATNTPAAKPALSPFWTLAILVAIGWGFARIAFRLFARSAPGAASYFSVEKRLSLLAVLVFMGVVYLLDLKYYLAPLSMGGLLPVLTDVAGLCCFLLLLILMWRAARHRYQQIFQRVYTPWAFVRANIKVNLPIVLPWLMISLLFDALRALPFPALARVLRSPWGEVVLFALFLVFLMFAFPPLVRTLWGCRPAAGTVARLLQVPGLFLRDLFVAAVRRAGSHRRDHGYYPQAALSAHYSGTAGNLERRGTG